MRPTADDADCFSRRIAHSDPNDEAAKTRRGIVKSSNFTGQTNAVDVDKHMCVLPSPRLKSIHSPQPPPNRMEYIESELRKRKPASESDSPFDKDKELRALDPRDELYKIAEKYRIEKKEVEEGNVQLSAAMLTAIPEVDLGIE